MDPACGSGNFVIMPYKEIRQAGNGNFQANSGTGT
ncbi:DNA methyltransferase [Ralstonia solanacearum]